MKVIFAHEIKKLLALAFVYIINVISAFEELINSNCCIQNQENLKVVVDYFKDTCIERSIRGSW